MIDVVDLDALDATKLPRQGIDLDALDALEKASHAAPWFFDADRRLDTDVIRNGESDVCMTRNTDSGTCRDTSLICALRNAYPSLRDEVRALRARAAEFDSAAAELRALRRESAVLREVAEAIQLELDRFKRAVAGSTYIEPAHIRLIRNKLARLAASSTAAAKEE
jgi:hypothetical protein